MLGLQYSEKALNHWTKWRPKMVADLRKQGLLDQEVQRASKIAADQVALLMEGGMQKFEAEEIVLPDVILLPPEE